MSVPLDNLYHWVESLIPNPVILYVFRPHGSKKISDCNWFRWYNQENCYEFPGVILHDQEPLDWQFYDCPKQYIEYFHDTTFNNFPNFNNIVFKYFCNFNLKSIPLCTNAGIYDQPILIHSEKNSIDLEKYQQNEFLCVYYWAHAIIARDWYRFAEYDTRLSYDPKYDIRLSLDQISKTKFLIYCRDWSHRREYRLKFLEMLVENDLDQYSKTSVMPINSENVHFLQHEFLNPAFKLLHPELILNISANEFLATASADYNYVDFVSTQVSVVLETVFDDSRIHLTEKTLRPIACGHPFILAAGPNSLEYIRSYGFKTFAPWIDESYDSEPDSLKRLEKIIQAMKQIQNLQGQELENFSQGIKNIAEFNKKHFFSNKFFDLVKSELKNNLDLACAQIKKSQGKHYLELLKLVKKHKLSHQIRHRKEKTRFIRQLRLLGQDNQSNSQVDQSL